MCHSLSCYAFYSASRPKGKNSQSIENNWLHLNQEEYTYTIDVPRGVPDEFKACKQIATGFQIYILVGDY